VLKDLFNNIQMVDKADDSHLSMAFRAGQGENLSPLTFRLLLLIILRPFSYPLSYGFPPSAIHCFIAS